MMLSANLLALCAFLAPFSSAQKDVCLVFVDLQPVEYDFLQPQLVDGNVVTRTSTSVTTWTRTNTEILANVPYTTITKTGTGIGGPTTLTYPPGSGDPTGTVIVEVPSSIFTGPWTTITKTDASITVPTTVTRPPSSGDPTGTVIVEVPSGTFTGPWTTITQTGSSITVPTTVTRPPSSGDPTGTVIVEVPSGTFTGPWTTITQTGSSITAPTTVTRPPSSGDPTGTVIVEVPPTPSTSPMTNTPTGTSATGSPPPGSASSNPSGTQAPSTTFTGPWTTITNTVTSITATTTLTQPPGSGVSTGTVIVEVPPATSAPPQAEPYEPCPDSGIQGSPTCCELNLAGVIAGECIAPDKTPSSGMDFEAICAENGRTPFCCVLSDVLNLAAACQKPVGVSE